MARFVVRRVVPSQHHFVGVYKSDWNGVSTNVCVNAGHEVGVHYYVVVHAGLPEETTEQLWRLSKALTGHLAWGRWRRRRCLPRRPKWHVTRAAPCSSARSTFSGRTKWENASSLNTTRSRKRHTETRCPPWGAASRSTGGAPAAKRRARRTHNGQPQGERPGHMVAPRGAQLLADRGGPWSHTETANAMPIFRNRKFDEVSTRLERFGYNNHWGKAFLSPIYVIE